MNIRFKKVNDKAVTPFRKHQWDAGVDLTAISVEYDEEDDVLVYDTGIAVEIPPGYTHNIENIGETDMVTVMWVNESFNPEKPDTYYLEV